MAKGHMQYKAWLWEVGRCFSPMFAGNERQHFGRFSSWTVEGLYQGLKLFSILEPSLLQPSLDFQTFQSGQPMLIHIPAIMDVREDLPRHPLFRLLKSSRKYNSTRNRLLGQLNWAWMECWRQPLLDIPVSRERFIEDVFAPALYLTLSKHNTEVSRLKASWAEGRNLITDEMLLAHGHLKHVERYVISFPDVELGGKRQDAKPRRET
jgi:hypothetical protein